MDKLLIELRSQYDAKREEAERLLLKDAATVEEATDIQKKADTASLEMEAIGRKIDSYNEAKKNEQAIQARLIKAREMSKPDRKLPFFGGGASGSESNNRGQKTDDQPVEFKRYDGSDFPAPRRSEHSKFATDTPASCWHQGLNELQVKAMQNAAAETKKFYIETGDSYLDKIAPTGGFKSLGHFAWAMHRRGPRGDGDPNCVEMLKNWDDLQRKSPYGMFEESDPDGGDLIPREFSNKIYERMMATNQILNYLQGLPLAGNTLTIPALKEDSRADGFRYGGVLGYWEGEADQYTRVSPKFRNINLKLHKLTVMTFVTEELLMDSAVALESYLGRLVPKEINFKINDAIINGRGGGMPLGIMKANSLITAAAVSGQTNGTIVYQNIPDMWRRAIASQRSTAVWFYNQDCESALFRLFMATGTAAGVAVYTPNELVEFKLMGRPALVMEQCQTIGTAGDLILFCPEGWATILKGGLQSFMSMHLRFDYDEFCYKWRFRMDAQPYDDVALTPYNGSNTYSSCVVLNSTRT